MPCCLNHLLFNSPAVLISQIWPRLAIPVAPCRSWWPSPLTWIPVMACNLSATSTLALYSPHSRLSVGSGHVTVLLRN